MESLYLSISSQQRATERCILNTLSQLKHFIERFFFPLEQRHKVKYKETYCELAFHQNVDVGVSVCVLNFKLCFG